MKTYLVGGAVRDHLLGLPVSERDWVVVGASPDKMLALGYQSVGKDFPVFLHPRTKEEYALARTERKTGRGYKGFTCYAAPEVTLEEDLLRRDLTINAIAMDENGRLIDPYQGIKDLKEYTLRHVSPAFEEDPVRVLRLSRFCARFYSLGFKVAPETQELASKMVREGTMEDLVPERVWSEIERSLAEKTPAAFFQFLREIGALARLMPELDQLFGVPNPPKWHPEIDTGVHMLMVLEQAAYLSSSPLVRFGALVHDLGKGCTPREAWPSHHGHDEAGVKLIQTLSARLKIPKVYEQLGVLVSRFHTLVHKARELKPGTLVQLLEKMDAFRRPERFYQLLAACEADSRGRLGFEKNDYPQRAFLMKIFEVIKNVSGKPWIDKGLSGKAVAEAVHRERVEIVKNYIYS